MFSDKIVSIFKDDDGNPSWFGIIVTFAFVVLLTREVLDYFDERNLRKQYEQDLEVAEEIWENKYKTLEIQLDNLTKSKLKNEETLKSAMQRASKAERELEKARNESEEFNRCMDVIDPRGLHDTQN